MTLMKDRSSGGEPMMLDLSDVDTVTAEGLRILLDFVRAYDRAGMQWSLVDTRVVRRLVDLAESTHRLPVANPVDHALKGMSDDLTSGRTALPIVAREKLPC